ncbi:hypothetical protein CKAN_01955000 [Cinnamomum micranthum f. kanehirae]|uniref:Uncharacterized protein n=1 Tax=Cinnamomum micranthum f. kanehirae TaxID=337451 RepID=A0A3S3QVS8_9MAGN|nr:hypothetical protein CKAN_01955000 [Cinnamomum micranthum f. kanehirae]
MVNDQRAKIQERSFLITCPGRDLGFSYRAIDVSRCRKLQENVEVTFTGEAALDSDDLLYLKEQMEAEEDAERLLRRTEKRAFAAFKISLYKAASLADSSPASLPLPLRVEPKTKSGIRQQDLLKNIVQIRPKRHRVSSPSSDQNQLSPISTSRASPDRNQSTPISTARASPSKVKEMETKHTSDKDLSSSRSSKGEEMDNKPENAAGSLLGLAYESSDED